MTTISHEPATATRSGWLIGARAMWTTLTIVAMWIVVLLDALFGPDIVAEDVSGTRTVLPSATVIALFALIGTVAVAKHGFGSKNDES